MRTILPTSFVLTSLVLSSAAFGADNAPQSTFALGGGALATSRFSGSDERFVTPMVIVDYQSANGFYASSLRGIGYATGAGPINVNAGVTYRCGRSEKDKINALGCGGSTKLEGMGEIKGSAVASFGVEAALGKMFTLNARAELPMSQRENGKLLAVGAGATLWSDSSNKVNLGASIQFGDSKYLQTYYGVTSSQAARSGYRPYKPGAGMFASRLELGWDHHFDEHWSLSTMAGMQKLSRDAGKSPIVKKTTVPTAGVYASYQF